MVSNELLGRYKASEKQLLEGPGILNPSKVSCGNKQFLLPTLFCTWPLGQPGAKKQLERMCDKGYFEEIIFL